jgi:hypothetical protein
MKAGGWVVVIAIIGVAVWWFTRDPVEVAYQKCLAAVELKMEQEVQSDSGNAAERAMADAVKGMGKAMGAAMCEAMKEACTKDRDGPLCKAALAQF